VRVAISHLTRLDFADEVMESVMDTHLGPRDDSDQRVERFDLRLEPAGHVRRYQDGFANTAHLLTHTRPHVFLQVTAESEVRTQLVDPFELPPRAPEPLNPMELADGLDPSPLVPRLAAVEELAAPFRTAEPADAFGVVRSMTEMIFRDFTYRQHVTDVHTSIESIVDDRQGVCQDFAHLLIGLCRALEVPARYVSGYIVVNGGTPTGRTEAPIPTRGSDASHAWVEAFTPTHGWRGFDPTNNLVANDRYVKIAIGRDYRDVPPTRGTYQGGGSERLTVAVTVRAIG
jgi:transglutaminase-like putative cysteine protease